VWYHGAHAVAKIVATGRALPQKKREALLKKLREQKRSCSYEMAVKVLKAWGFECTQRPGNPAHAWSYEDIQISFHKPHGKADMDKGAVAHIINAIEDVRELLLRQEKVQGAKRHSHDEST
jgi:hypothetical protein